MKTSDTREGTMGDAPDGEAAAIRRADAAVHPGCLEELHAIAGARRPDAVRLIVDLFLEDARTGIYEIRAAIEAADLKRIAQRAHMLKSSSASVGAIGLNALFLELEHTARAGDADALAPLLLRLQRGYDTASARLEQICANLQAGATR